MNPRGIRVKLALSVRIAETAAKDRLTLPFHDLAALARRDGYHAVCLRPSVVGAATPRADQEAARRTLDELGLAVSMATTDLSVPLNNEHGPDCLRDIDPHLDAAAALGTDLIRVCLKNDDDIAWAQRAADQARERRIRLAHQCHTDSLCETVSGCLETLDRIGRPNFGLIYEPANLMLCGEPYGPDVLRRLAPYIMNVYVQNHRLNSQGKSVILTRAHGDVRYDLIPLWAPGGVAFRRVFEGLAAIAYDGYVTVHQAYAEIMGPQEAASRSAEFLRSVANFAPPLGAP
jgi:sugar phosphate isomerase/epimerase